MTKITGSQFRDQMKNGVDVNDAATQQRLNKAGVDGKALLQGADLNRDGRVGGTQEVDKLFQKIDDFDADGSTSSVTGKKAVGLVNALKAPAEPSATGSTSDLYAPDPAGGIARGAKGPEVKAAQEKLVKAGYDLPRYGADGSFGAETERAVKKFQTDNKLDPTGALDAGTVEKLNNAKPAATSKVQFPEYDKMFKDGVMQTTLGVGFDEDGNDIGLKKQLLDGLQERGFQRLDVANLSDAQLKQKGFDPAQIDRTATYYTKPFKHEGKDVQALVKLVDRNSPDAKGQFAKGMQNDDLVIYGGHARRGSGPDFDHANSDKGNYVIGKPYEDGHYKLGANDVSKKGALGDQYQLMFFDACSSKHYVDDLRSRPKNKNADNLDIVASTRELPWSTGKADAFLMLDGVMGGKSINDIKAGLDRTNAEAGKGDAFIADGFQRNSYRPAQTQAAR